jgi:hypothetical protein
VPLGATGAPSLRAGDRVIAAYGVLADHAAASLRLFLPNSPDESAILPVRTGAARTHRTQAASAALRDQEPAREHNHEGGGSSRPRFWPVGPQ